MLQKYLAVPPTDCKNTIALPLEGLERSGHCTVRETKFNIVSHYISPHTYKLTNLTSWS